MCLYSYTKKNQLHTYEWQCGCWNTGCRASTRYDYCCHQSSHDDETQFPDTNSVVVVLV